MDQAAETDITTAGEEWTPRRPMEGPFTMLVLHRNTADAILVTDGDTGRHLATVEILATQGDRVSVGITAPPNVAILRGELSTAHGTKPARYTCRQCGHLRLVTGNGAVTFNCHKCHAFDWEAAK